MKRWGNEYIDNRDWRKYNEELVVRGEFYLDLGWVKSWDRELKKMNKGKRGAKFRYPESLIRLQAVWQQWIDYRGIEGVTRKLAEYGLIPQFNDFSTVNRRVNRLDIEFILPEGKDVNVSVDGSGVKMTNGGNYRERRYGDDHRKPYIKVTISADPKKRKLLDCSVTVEGFNSSEPDAALKHLKKLKEKGKKVKKFWGDAALDKRELINYLAGEGADIAIKPNKLVASDAEESRERKKLVEEFNKKGYKKWAGERGYGLRWVGTEGMFSAVKRKFGECVKSKELCNMFKEVKRKFWAYDLIQQYGILHR